MLCPFLRWGGKFNQGVMCARLLPTTREGNFFKSMCHSVHRKGEDGCTPLSGGRFPLDRDPLVLTSSGSHYSSQYTSYWNAFLFNGCFPLKNSCLKIDLIDNKVKSFEPVFVESSESVRIFGKKNPTLHSFYLSLYLFNKLIRNTLIMFFVKKCTQNLKMWY